MTAHKLSVDRYVNFDVSAMEIKPDALDTIGNFEFFTGTNKVFSVQSVGQSSCFPSAAGETGAGKHLRIKCTFRLQYLPGILKRKNRAAVETSGRSAVLVALYPDSDESLKVILTRRSPNLRSHTLEVSFPGGREDAEDKTLWHTAIREAHEEVDLDPSLPKLVGELDRFVTVGSGSLIHPFVAILDERPHLTASPDEVSEIIEVRLDELLLDEVWREELWRRGDKDWSITFFELFGNTVWGATAAILRQFLAELTGVIDDRWGEYGK